MEKIQQAEIKDKKILVRGDVDVEVKNGKVVDDYRLKALLPTLKYLSQRQPEQIVIVGHKGRPRSKGQDELEEVRGNNPELILKPIADRFRQLLNFSQPLEETKLDGFPAYRASKDVYLLENIRFDYRETRNDDTLAKSLSKLADLFIFDAFASSHRSHASTKGVQKFLPSYLGLRCQEEVKKLGKIKKDPERPFVVLVGGAKLEDKQPVLVNLASIADELLIGGKVANSIYQAKFAISGKQDVLNLIEAMEKKELVKKRDNPVEEILTAQGLNLPVDGKLEGGDVVKMSDVRQGTSHLIPEIRDIGPQTIQNYVKILEKAEMIFWAGPMGMFEKEQFENGTAQLMKALSKAEAKVYAAGGDTHRAIKKFKCLSEFDFISTGGGAALDYLADKTLAVFSDKIM